VKVTSDWEHKRLCDGFCTSYVVYPSVIWLTVHSECVAVAIIPPLLHGKDITENRNWNNDVTNKYCGIKILLVLAVVYQSVINH